MIAQDGLTLTAASLTNSGLMAGAGAQFNSASVTNGGRCREFPFAPGGDGGTAQQLEPGMLLSGGALGLHHHPITTPGSCRATP